MCKEEKGCWEMEKILATNGENVSCVIPMVCEHLNIVTPASCLSDSHQVIRHHLQYLITFEIMPSLERGQAAVGRAEETQRAEPGRELSA